MSDQRGKVDSPCIAVCTYLPESKVCRGCFRRIEEIWGWPKLNSNARRAVLKKSKQRKTEYMHGANFSV